MSLIKDNASFGGGEDEREDLDGLCDDFLRDELLSDQMSDGANLPAATVDRDTEAKPIADKETTEEKTSQPVVTNAPLVSPS